MMDNARSVKNYNKVMSRSINKQLWVCFPAVSVCLLYNSSFRFKTYEFKILYYNERFPNSFMGEVKSLEIYKQWLLF